jgi:transcriptional regulator with XRE-family HTH domain
MRLRQALTLVGLSQKQLGIQAGMDPSVASVRVNQYVKGKHEPSFVIEARLAGVLHLPVAFFYSPEDDLAALIATYPRLSVRTRKALAKLIKPALAGKSVKAGARRR